MNVMYVRGFMDKCAELGVDPEVLAKSAQYANTGLNGLTPMQQALQTSQQERGAGRIGQNMAGNWNKAVTGTSNAMGGMWNGVKDFGKGTMGALSSIKKDFNASTGQQGSENFLRQARPGMYAQPQTTPQPRSQLAPGAVNSTQYLAGQLSTGPAPTPPPNMNAGIMKAPVGQGNPQEARERKFMGDAWVNARNERTQQNQQMAQRDESNRQQRYAANSQPAPAKPMYAMQNNMMTGLGQRPQPQPQPAPRAM